MTKKLLLFIALMCAFAQGAWAQNYEVWDGETQTAPHASSNNTIEINTAAELAWLMYNFRDGSVQYGNVSISPYSANFNLNADINMDSRDWKPFDNYEQGTFNGNGHTIRYIITNGTNDNCQGLFGEMKSGSKVENLHVDCYILVGDSRKVGGICGDNYGTIENCYVSGHVESAHYNTSLDADLGGIAGLNEGTIQYCCMSGIVKNTGNNSGVGGIAGRNLSGKTISHVTFYGSVVVDHSQDNKWVGVSEGTLNNNYDSFSSGEYNASSGKVMYRCAIKYPAEANPFSINSIDDWNQFTTYVNYGFPFNEKTVNLYTDISITSAVDNLFRGTFDGNGHTITADIKEYNKQGMAVFRYIYDATIRNLKIAGEIDGHNYSAGCVGFSKGVDNLIENCVVTAFIDGADYVGGIVGHALNSDITISGCVYDNWVNCGFLHKGIIIGWGDSGSWNVTNCLYVYNYYQNPDNLDLVKGNGDITVTNCYKTTDVGSYGIEAAVLNSEPGNLGSLVEDYGMVKAYQNGILYDGKYYFTANLTLDGQGTEGDPYRINNTEAWDHFVNNVNNGYTFSSKFVKLTANVDGVTTMAGTDDVKSFQGTFNGDGHKLTFTKGSSQDPFNEDYCAPFRHVKDATIKNLHVDGTIYTSAMKAAGFVGESHGALNITNCRSSVNINSSKNGDGTHGGFVATLSGANNTITISGCVFDGSFATTNGTTNCGGFVGWPVYNRPTITNSLMKPTSVHAGMLNNTFARWHTTYEPTITNCYFMATDNLPTDQGKQAYSITSGPDVTVANAGVATEYNVSSITGYGTGIKYNGVLYAGDGENVSLNLSCPAALAAFGYTISAGTLTGTANPYTLEMPDSNVTINTAVSWSQILQPDANGDYLIGSTDHWMAFCEMMRQGINNFSGKTVKLTDDINVSTMAGANEANAFQGTFLGGGHTITATITDTIADNNLCTALFRYINGATIKNLKVAGTITSNHWGTAALVGSLSGTGNSIENCEVTANLSGGECVSGIVGTSNSYINITGCVFSGLMTGGSNRIGAFIGTSIFGDWIVTDCLYIMPDGQNTSNFDLVQNVWGTATISRCYKTTDAGSQGTTARNITGSTGVTVSNISPVGDSVATYSVSGITAYAKGITCGEIFYYGNGDEVNLDLSSIATSPVEYYASSGSLNGNENPYLFTMPDTNVVINVKALQSISNGKWYVISTPMHEQGETFENISQVENLTGDSYDLFRYSEIEAKWENQKAGDGALGFDNLAIGRGYIYRCNDDRTLTFNGELNSAETYSVTLTATDAAGELKGYNLIGNPYPFRVHLNRDYLTLNPDGTVSEHYLPHSDSLEVGQGALVYTPIGEILTFYASTRSTNAGTNGLPPLPKGFFLNESDGSTSSPQDNENEDAQANNRPFAYISGNQLIVEGTGTLQIFDIMGRELFRKNVSTHQPINVSTFPQAVYILRLNGQSQKIIIR